MNLLNPYNLLGVSIDSTLRELRKSYYTLSLICHPDKGGSKEDMDVVHKAYLYVKEQLENNETQTTYEEAEAEFERFCKEQEEKPPPFSKIDEENNDFIRDFNREFDRVHSSIAENAANHNIQSTFYYPFEQGYGHLMEKSQLVDINDINFECSYGEKQKKDALEEPVVNVFSKEVIIYKEPHSLPDTYGYNYNFNVKKIDDFSDKISKNFECTDYLKAFSPAENVEHLRKSYKSIDELLEERKQFDDNLVNDNSVNDNSVNNTSESSPKIIIIN